MAIYDVSVDNTIRIKSSVSYDMYFALDTTSLEISVTSLGNSDRSFSLNNSMAITVTPTLVWFTPYYITLTSTMGIDSGIIVGKDIQMYYSSSMNITASYNEFFDIDNRLVRYAPLITGETTMPDSISRSVVGEMVLTSGSLTLTMPKPEFGDTDTVEVTVHSSQLSSGTVVINPQTTTNVRSKDYTFIGICSEKKKEFQTFVCETFGQVVQLTDFEGATTDILITSIDSEIIETNKGFDFELKFEEV